MLLLFVAGFQHSTQKKKNGGSNSCKARAAALRALPYCPETSAKLPDIRARCSAKCPSDTARFGLWRSHRAAKLSWLCVDGLLILDPESGKVLGVVDPESALTRCEGPTVMARISVVSQSKKKRPWMLGIWARPIVY